MDLSYKNNILLGSAMIDAYEGEGKAAPFGIFVHDSAKKTDGDNSRTTGAFQEDWKWFTSSALKIEDKIITAIPAVLKNYFNDAPDYENKNTHRDAASKYFETVI